jgi:DNA-binding protein HU-beta
MKKRDLVERVSERVGISKRSADEVVSAFVNSITESLSKGERVVLMGFGSFMIRERAKRKGRNPKTGKELTIPARKVVRFYPGNEMWKKIGK